MKQSLGARCALLLICGVFGVLAVGNPGAARAAPQSFVAQGTAPLQPNNRAQSRDQALEDLLRQAVLQALGTFVPGQVLAEKNKEIRKDILAQPGRYAQSFKILGEYVDGDLYRIQGVVDVAVGALRADAEKLGIVPAPAVPQGESPPVPEPPESVPGSGAEPRGGPSRASPEEAPSKRVLWVVAENWDGSWNLPAEDSPSAHGSLCDWAVQEASDYGWRLERLPSSTGLGPPPWDAETQKRIMEQARRQGWTHGVFGTAQRAGKVFEVRLKVVETASGRLLGVVEERVATLGGEPSEALVTLAEVVVSRVDALLSGTPAATPPSSPGPATAGPATAPPGTAAGPWEIAVKGDAAFAAWLSMEKRLSEASKEFAVDSVVLEGEAVVVRAKNVDPEAVGKLHGMRVGLALVLRLEGIDPTARKITMTIAPESAQPQGPEAQESKTP